MLLSLLGGDSGYDIGERIVDDVDADDGERVKRSRLRIGLEFDVVEGEEIEEGVVDDATEESVDVVEFWRVGEGEEELGRVGIGFVHVDHSDESSAIEV